MKKIVISLGGSLIVPKVGFLDLNFIKKFKNLILKFARKYRIFIVVGGGKLARFYQQEARHLKIKRTDLDWLGIFASRLNTQFVKSFFDQQSFSEIVTSPLKKIKTKKIVFLSGWKPGWTTDFVATKICQVYKVKEILNLTNVDYIYDRDPRKNKKAKPLKKISWSDYLKIIGRRFKPGGNYPFDPVASLLAKKLKIKLISLNGKNLKAVDNYLTGKKFIGSIIK
ncbi:MAG: UMP kinase [Patescibacteria group bacterium]|nr:UMP kinase [Patescibacteria group bacterium]